MTWLVWMKKVVEGFLMLYLTIPIFPFPVSIRCLMSAMSFAKVWLRNTSQLENARKQIESVSTVILLLPDNGDVNGFAFAANFLRKNTNSGTFSRSWWNIPSPFSFPFFLPIFPSYFAFLFFLGLTNYFFSDDGNIFDSKCSTLYQDMDQPLSHYYINSSHNT